ncbi:MAG: hypothetical protein NVSMB51_02940 [Solirubrobacteraceae bacterium]
MALYTADSKERVRDAVDMVDLVGSRTELRRAGADSFVGLCPFHDERSPSFSVKPSDKVFYCFGCQASGDVFSFVMQAEGLDFKGALELLADRYSVELELEAEDPAAAASRRRRERLLELLERTCSYYERVLWDAPEAAAAREYLLGRGLTEPLLREFRVGYAPSERDRVLAASRRGGYSERELWDVGLLARGQGAVTDRFRARIMFPLCDLRGRVVGFGGRATREDQRGKYINTAETEVFHKGENVYAAHLARAEAARAARVVVCEGYTDVIAMHGAGVRSAVGLMGTALTEQQVAQLGRLAPTVLLALDADGAGFKAMLKAADLTAKRRLELRVVRLPPGSDPADIARDEGGEALRELVGGSVAFVRFQVERVLAAGELGSPEGRDRVLGELRPLLSGLGPSAMRDELSRLVAERLSLSEKLAASLLDGPAPALAAGSNTRGALAPLDARARSERVFLSLCIALPEQGRRALADIDLAALFTDTLTRSAAEHLREHLDSPAAQLGDDGLASLLAELAVRGSQGPAAPAQLEAARLQLELAQVDREIAGSGAGGRVSELAARRRAIKERLEQALEQVLEASGTQG